jgi:AraC family transcriptional regulator
MPPRNRRILRTDTMPRTIRQTSDAMQFGGLRVLVRELPAAGELDVPGGLDHFCFCYWPRPDGAMILQQKNGKLGDLTEGSPLFIAPGWPFQCEWQKIETVVANFQLQRAFLEEAATLLRVEFRRLYKSAVLVVSLDEPLESLCRLLMQEVATGCKHGSSFFESLSRALAVALVQRLFPTRPALARDPRIERAVRFIDEHFQEKISLKQVAEIANLSPYHFLRSFTATIGISPHDYIIRCRLRHAQRLIVSSARSRLLADIAVEAGFYDEAHLASHFRRVFGQPPGRWLRQQ